MKRILFPAVPSVSVLAGMQLVYHTNTANARGVFLGGCSTEGVFLQGVYMSACVHTCARMRILYYSLTQLFNYYNNTCMYIHNNTSQQSNNSITSV